MTPDVLVTFTIAFAVMSLLGYFVTSMLCGRRFSNWMVWALAPVVGAGICSFIGFIFRRPMFTIEFALLIALSAAWLLKRGFHTPDLSSLATARVPILGVILAGFLAWSLSGSIMQVERSPHGAWDGFAIWNSHARFLYRDGPGWQTSINNTFHPDYPLLVPSMTVRLWRYLGQDPPEAGGIFNVMFALCGVGLLAAAVAELRGPSMGLLMALVLIGTPLYLLSATAQEADAMLSVFIMGTIALLGLYFEKAPDRPGVLVLAGFMAGCAGWTKNEGLLFIAATSAVLLLPVIWKPRITLRRIAAFTAGVLLPLAVIIAFKVAVAPADVLTANRHYAEIAEKLLNPDRYLITMGNFISTSWSFGGWALQPMIPLLIFIASAGVDRKTLRRPAWLAGIAILCIVLAGYFSVYVLTPMDLNWHLSSSLNRLLMHLWPATLFLAALAVRPRGDPEIVGIS